MHGVKVDNQNGDPTFDATLHNIISLSQALKGDRDALGQMKKEFISKGWCIIQLPEKPQFSWFGLVQHAHIPTNTCLAILNSFFANAPEGTKHLSYSTTPHKQSVHINTPNQALEIPIMKQWASVLDGIASELIEKLAGPVFEVHDGASLARAADLPLAHGLHMGMLDIVRYYNNQTTLASPEVGYSTTEVNCVPHFDPGLLSISFFSSFQGLQLRDPTNNTWFAGPVNTNHGQENFGVIWLGEAAVAASEGKFQSGIHRVVYPHVAHPRITAWYEICTMTQARNEANDESPKEGTFTLRNIFGAFPKINFSMKSELDSRYGLASSKPLYTPSGSAGNPLFR